MAAVTLRTCFSFTGGIISACLLSGRLGMLLSLNNVPDLCSFLREFVLTLPNIVTPLKAGVIGKFDGGLFVHRIDDNQLFLTGFQKE